MPIKIFNFPQNSLEWYESRSGLATASQFHTVLAKGKGGGESITRRKYMYQLAAERISGELTENYSNGYMQRGHELEPEARAAYEFVTDNEAVQVGFVTNHGCGASPDSMIDETGLLEIKTRTGQLQIELLLSGEVPKAHTAQIQGQIFVCEKEWCDFSSYSKGIKIFIKRVYRDDEFINKILWPAITKFNQELDQLIERINNV